jgi:uncharacterized protein YacL
MMKVSLNFLVRIAGMLMLAYIANRVGRSLSANPPSPNEELATALLTLAGAGLGLLTAPRWTIEPLQRGIRYVRSISMVELTAVVFGAVIGLFCGLLLAVPLAYLPPPFGQFLPIVAAGGLAYLGAVIFSARRKEIGDLMQSTNRSSLLPGADGAAPPPGLRFLLDTSVIIDGRIGAVAQAGFVNGTLLVPQFVLNELQLLADSADEIRRSKGRRGLEMLTELQKRALPPVEVLDIDVENVREVDDKLVVLARRFGCPVITNDYNLGRVAEIQGVKVMSLNQLAEAVRPVVTPGQELNIVVRDVGREREQGISFLDDGTMIVIEEAKKLVGERVSVSVTRVYQTQTGRIVFAHLKS